MVSKQEYMAQFGIKESSPPGTPSQEKLQGSDAISKKREELELRRLEIELEKLSKPDTNIDYYSKMLELQQKSFEQQLTMQKQQLDLRLEIEKLKLMGDGESESMMPYLQMFMPLLPKLLENSNSPKFANSGVPKKEGLVGSAENPPQSQEKQEEDKMKVPTTLAELEEYKKAIKDGEISEEEAYEDFLQTPFASSMTKEQFKIKFEELKKSI